MKEQRNEICLKMRVFDLMKKNSKMLDADPEFKDLFKSFSENI
jgi:hypothetical protein